jgi:molybdopterin-guanine dinucleotide biosynthesis protein A
VTRTTGGILAGGAGRRFGGADKGWLLHRGHSFIEHVRNALAPQVDDIVISANRSLERYSALGHRVVVDELGVGPASGLLALMETATHPWLLCVPVDALALPPALAREMHDVQWAEEADLVVLHDGDGAQPTCCLVRTALADDLERYLRDGRSALGRWQARHRLAHLHVSSPFLNVNDAQALARLGS